MAIKKTSLINELKKIEREEGRIEAEESRIDQKEDLIRAFEELGLMRWKSYYVLTAGAILLLALTLVTSLWLMNSQLEALQVAVSKLDAKMSAPAPARDWCPAGQTIDIALAGNSMRMSVVGKEERNGILMCHSTMVTETPDGPKSVDVWMDESGSVST